MSRGIHAHRARAVLCAAVSMLAWSGSALAQQQKSTVPAENATNDDIVVTATRRTESLKNVPMSVNVASGQQLERLNLFDFKDVQQLAPGLELTNNDGRSNIATLRGITFDPDSGTPPAVDIYFNEISVDAQTAFTAIYDIAQIEVLRGPQGIFRGRTSPAGSITLSTRRPNLNEPEGYMQGTVNNRHAVNVQGAASVPLIPGVLALRGAVLVDFNRNNQVRNVTRGDRSRGDTESGRLSLAFEPSPDFKAVLTYQYLTSDVRPYQQVIGTGNQPGLLLGDPSRTGPVATIDDRIAVSEGALRFRNRTHLLTFAADWQLSDALTLSTNSGYQNTVLLQDRDMDYGNAAPNYVQHQHVRTPYKVFTTDWRLTGDTGGFLSWTLGGYYSHQNNPVVVQQANDTLFGLPFAPLPASFAFPVDVTVRVPVKQDIYSAVGTARFKISEKLTVEAGLRYTYFKISQQSFLTVDLPSLGITQLDNFPTISAQNARRSYRPLTGGATVRYAFTPDLTAYASYGRSYRPGSAAVGVTTPLSDALLLSKSEKTNAFEIGLKGDILDRHMSFTIAGFYQKFKNYIGHEACLTTDSAADGGATDPSCTPLNTNGDATSKGVEATVSGRAGGFNGAVSMSYVHANYDNALLYCNDYNGDGIPDSVGTPSVPVGQQVAVCRRNDRVAQQPRFNLSANAEYSFTVGTVDPFIRGLVVYRPGFLSTQDAYRYRDFTNVSLFVGLRGKDNKWELAAYSKNLLNQARVLRISQGEWAYSTTGIDPVTFQPNGTAGAPFNSGYRLAVTSVPREFGITAKFNF